MSNPKTFSTWFANIHNRMPPWLCVYLCCKYAEHSELYSEQILDYPEEVIAWLRGWGGMPHRVGAAAPVCDALASLIHTLGYANRGKQAFLVVTEISVSTGSIQGVYNKVYTYANRVIDELKKFNLHDEETQQVALDYLEEADIDWPSEIPTEIDFQRNVEPNPSWVNGPRPS